MENFRGVVIFQDVRTRAAGMKSNLLARIFFKRLRANHHAGRMGKLIDEGRERRMERNAHRIVINDFGFGNVHVERVASERIVLIRHAVEIGFDGIGFEFRTVMEHHAFSERHRVDQAVLTHFVAGCKGVLKLHVLVETKKPFVH
jgi:hypothetical protein